MLEDFIETNNLSATIIKCEKEVSNAKAAAAALNVELSDIAKSILFFDEQKQEPLLVVLLGNCKVDLEKVSKVTGFNSLELATPKQALEITGYELGGIPPISIYGVKTIVDKKVLQKEVVFAGGGDGFSMLKISPKEIQDFGFEVQIEDICAD